MKLETKLTKIEYVRKCVQVFATEIQAIKVFMKEQLYFKKSLFTHNRSLLFSENKSNTNAVGSTINELHRKDNKFLSHEPHQKNLK